VLVPIAKGWQQRNPNLPLNLAVIFVNTDPAADFCMSDFPVGSGAFPGTQCPGFHGVENSFPGGGNAGPDEAIPCAVGQANIRVWAGRSIAEGWCEALGVDTHPTANLLVEDLPVTGRPEKRPHPARLEEANNNVSF